MNTTEQELNEILEYQIETIIRRDTTYEFKIIDSDYCKAHPNKHK